MVAKARRENVDIAAMLPPGLALRRERDDLPARAARLRSEAEVRALADDYNARVEAFWRRPQESRWSPVPGLADVEALVAEWHRNRPAPAGPAPRRWLRRGVAGSTGGGRLGEDDGMRFLLEVDLDAGALAGENRAAELGRILRFWGGA